MTSTRTEPRTVGRRSLLRGGLVGGTSLVVAACSSDDPIFSDGDDVRVRRVAAVPTDPDADTWAEAAVLEVELEGQVQALPHRREPIVPTIAVRAVRDEERIAFRLDWADPEADESTVRVDGFRDACAVLVAPGDGDESVRVMGRPDQAATLLHWKADWQRDLDHGRQDADDEFPNRSVDAYPPLLVDDPLDVSPADYEAAGATQWLPGLHVGNVISAGGRTSPVEKIIARSFGTTSPAPTQDATGRGVRRDGGWSVVISKPLAATDADEADLRSGQPATCAFAIWAGSDGDAGGKKSPSRRAFRLITVDR